MITGKKVKEVLKKGEFVPAKTRVAMTPDNRFVLFASFRNFPKTNWRQKVGSPSRPFLAWSQDESTLELRGRRF